MEALTIKMFAALKWLFPAVLGSAFAAYSGERQTPVKTFISFVSGVVTAAIFGGAAIQYWSVPVGWLQAAIYFSIGLWGMGIVIQISEKTPNAIDAIIQRLTR